MSSLIDIIVGFFAALLSAAFLHFGAGGATKPEPKPEPVPVVATTEQTHISETQTTETQTVTAKTVVTRVKAAPVPAPAPQPAVIRMEALPPAPPAAPVTKFELHEVMAPPPPAPVPTLRFHMSEATLSDHLAQLEIEAEVAAAMAEIHHHAAIEAQIAAERSAMDCPSGAIEASAGPKNYRTITGQ